MDFLTMIFVMFGLVTVGIFLAVIGVIGYEYIKFFKEEYYKVNKKEKKK